MPDVLFFGLLGAYLLVGRWLIRGAMRRRELVFGALNLAVIYLLFFRGPSQLQHFAEYIALVSLQYVALKYFGLRRDWLAWLAFFSPLLVLIALHYVPMSWLAKFSGAVRWRLAESSRYRIGQDFIGLSYLCFRTSYLALEVRNETVKRPGFLEYLGFAFFAPTILVGPISPYAEHQRAFLSGTRPDLPLGRALLRILVGGVKLKFLGPVFGQLGYAGLLLDGNNPHPWVDLAIAMVAYYLFLYCNFSGFCDIAIGAAGVMGVPVAENFNNPFAARNMKDFWNRWHITLSQYMRDVVFSPLSKTLVRLMGPDRADHAIGITILVVFLLVGVWHGVGLNYALFGAACALGVAVTHYYTLALKKRLGRDRFAAYNRNKYIHAAAVSVTFVYFSMSLFLFANSMEQMKAVLAALRHH